MSTYICERTVEANIEMKNGKDGYRVTLKDGSTFWTPKERFEKVCRKE